MSIPRVIPVLDIMGGVVVRGVAGERHSYRPIQSQLTAGANPLELAQAIHEHFQLHEFYIADLDAIRGGTPHWQQLKSLVDAGYSLSVDAAVQDLQRAEQLLQLGAQRVIVGLESLRKLDQVLPILDTFGPSQVVFSLDLKHGEPLGPAAAGSTPWEIGCQLLSWGLRRLLILDLAAVGMGTGIPTLILCHHLQEAWPEAILWTGGGVRSRADLVEAGQAGVEGVLVASALHDGRLSDIQEACS